LKKRTLETTRKESASGSLVILKGWTNYIVLSHHIVLIPLILYSSLRLLQTHELLDEIKVSGFTIQELVIEIQVTRRHKYSPTAYHAHMVESLVKEVQGIFRTMICYLHESHQSVDLYL
jgi:hypothetical protein